MSQMHVCDQVHELIVIRANMTMTRFPEKETGTKPREGGSEEYGPAKGVEGEGRNSLSSLCSLSSSTIELAADGLSTVGADGGGDGSGGLSLASLRT